MDRKQKRHLAGILEQFSDIASAKYEKGAEEHEGYVWDNPSLLDEAIDEAVDLVIYLLTLKQNGSRQKERKF